MLERILGKAEFELVTEFTLRLALGHELSRPSRDPEGVSV